MKWKPVSVYMQANVCENGRICGVPDHRNVKYAVFTVVVEHLCTWIKYAWGAKGEWWESFKREKINIISPWFYSETVMNAGFSTVEEKIK